MDLSDRKCESFGAKWSRATGLALSFLVATIHGHPVAAEYSFNILFSEKDFFESRQASAQILEAAEKAFSSIKLAELDEDAQATQTIRAAALLLEQAAQSFSNLSGSDVASSKIAEIKQGDAETEVIAWYLGISEDPKSFTRQTFSAAIFSYLSTDFETRAAFYRDTTISDILNAASSHAIEISIELKLVDFSAEPDLERIGRILSQVGGLAAVGTTASRLFQVSG